MELDIEALGDLTAEAVGEDGEIDVQRRNDGPRVANDDSKGDSANSTALLGAIAGVGALALCLGVALCVVTFKYRSLVKHGQNAAQFQQLQEDNRL